MTAAPAVLLVDDDDDLREALAAALVLADLPTVNVADGAQALAVLDRYPINVVVSDVRMPGLDGRQLLQRILDRDAEMPVILMTGHGDIDQAVAALKQGAYDFLAKPFATERLIEAVERAIGKRQLVLENRSLRAVVARQSEQQQLPLMGSSAAIQQLVHAVAQIGGTGIDVLIEGEWGTGKQAVAQLLARAEGQRRPPPISFACEALPEHLLDAALFGHSATSAPRRSREREGAVAAARGGTLLLSGVECLSLAVQARLLHGLTPREIDAVGGAARSAAAQAGEELPVRVISTTTANLPDRVAAGTFRADLFFRLAPVRLVVPPLRERRGDIPMVFMRMLSAAAEQYRRPVPDLSDAMLARLTEHDWPGNLRELQNFADQTILNLASADAKLAGGAKSSLPERVAAFEAETIRSALRAEAGRISAACARLGVPRKTFYDKLAKYAIKPADFRP